ncbi:MAG: hypothetical protein WAM70_22350, partial [Pyrinomonadaceae bacterium]
LELARVKSPTGGYSNYNYSGIIDADADGFSAPAYYGGGFIYRRVASVKNFEETDQLVNEKAFSNIPQEVAQSHPAFPVLDNLTIDIKDANGTVFAKSRHYFYETALWPFAASNASFGKEYKSEILDPVSQAVLRRTETTWRQREAFPWCGGFQGFYTCFPDQVNFPNSAPAVDPRVIEIKTTLENGLVTKKTFSHDQYNNVTDTYEYDLGDGQPGPFLRRSHADYVTDANYTSHTGAYLLRLKSQTWVSSDINGNSKAALIQFEYDNYVADSHHAPLLPRSNISGFDVNYHAGLTRRGNLTSATSFVNAQNQTGPISSYSQYDIVGNIVKTIDAREHATTFDFSDRFGAPDAEAQSNTPPTELASVGQSSYAFATKTTNALGHVSYSQFDYYLSRPVNTQDSNGVVGSTYFADPADRMTKTIRAVNDPQTKNQTSIAYDDANRVVTTTNDLHSFDDPNPVKLQVILDSFGRQIEARQYETATTYIAVQTRYDAMGRGNQTSNPFRPLAPHNESAAWTTRAFDAMGRVVSVTTPDNAVLVTAYNGDRVLVKDPAGKQRLSKTDALGRLRDVWEITTADSATEAVSFPGFADVVAGYRTSYSYDTIDNLVTVNQGSQTRTFAYDSVSRLLSAFNPESGTVCYGTVVSGQCQPNGYDGNGNLTIKTDARTVVTNYAYDALNRLTIRNYSDSTPD